MSASIDHVFEKHWLKRFFEHIIDPNAPYLATLSQSPSKINCDDLHDYFFGLLRNRNYLGDLFNATPGGDMNFLGLAGMARGMNDDSKVMCPNRLTSNMQVANAAVV